MDANPSLGDRLPGLLKALAIGIPFGWLFARIGSPLPWMIGPMVAIALCSMAGMRLFPVPFGRQLGQTILGSAVGLYFTPAVAAALLHWLGVIALATALAFVIGGLGAWMLSRTTKIAFRSCFFASIPGGAMEMAVLAERHGASVPPVALAHSLRIAIVVLVIPFALTFTGLSGGDLALRPVAALDMVRLVPWLLAALAVGAVGERLGVQNSYLLLPLFLAAGLTVGGVTLSAVPSLLIDFAQLMFGLVLGVRFERAFLARNKLFIPFALVNGMIVLVLSAAVGIGLALWTGLPMGTLITGTAPGGFAEMVLTAEVLALGVPLVVAFHLFRVVLVNLGTHYVFLAGSGLHARLGGGGGGGEGRL